MLNHDPVVSMLFSVTEVSMVLSPWPFWLKSLALSNFALFVWHCVMSDLTPSSLRHWPLLSSGLGEQPATASVFLWREQAIQCQCCHEGRCNGRVSAFG